MHCYSRRGAEALSKTFKTRAIFTGMKGMKGMLKTLGKAFKAKAVFTVNFVQKTLEPACGAKAGSGS